MKRVVKKVRSEISVEDVIESRKLYVCPVCFKYEGEVFGLKESQNGRLGFSNKYHDLTVMYPSTTFRESIIKAINDGKEVLFFDSPMDLMKHDWSKE